MRLFLLSFFLLLAGCGAPSSSQPISPSQELDSYDYVRSVFVDVFNEEFLWENRGQERAVSDTFRADLTQFTVDKNQSLLDVETIREVTGNLNYDPMAPETDYGCFEVEFLNVRPIEQGYFYGVSVRCESGYAVLAIVPSDTFLNVWLITQKETPFDLDEATTYSAQIALSLERRIWSYT